MMLEQFYSSPLFGIVITLAAYSAGSVLYRKFNMPLLHPVLTASVAIMIIITGFGIDIEDYQNGGSIISFMLAPATVSLAVPLYRQIKVITAQAAVIIVSIFTGAVVSILSVIAISKAVNLPEELILSLVPKSVTTPIAVEISEKLNGLPSITALAVIFTGITGAVAGPWLLKVFKIKIPTAKGLAMGTSAHAIGTARALELGETEGAASGLSIGLSAIITAAAAPIIIGILL